MQTCHHDYFIFTWHVFSIDLITLQLLQEEYLHL